MADSSELNQEVTGAAQDATAAQKEHEAAVDATHSAEENVAKSIAKAKKGVQESIEAAREAREEADGYNAEEQAAAQGDIISIEEALALIEQQKKADKMATKAQMQAFSDSAEYLGTAFVETTGMVLDTADSLLNGLKDGVTSKAILPYLGTVGLGAGVGLFIQNEDLQHMVINGINAFTGLQSDGSDVDEKFVAGVTTPDEQGEWLATNGNGVPSDPYSDAQPGDTPDSTDGKEITGGSVTPQNTGLEATEASGSELADLADLDKVTSGEALFGDTKLGQWMDNMAKMFDESGNSPASGLLTSIADTAMPGIGTVIQTIGKVGPNLSKLLAAKDEVDNNPQNNNPENNGPEVGA